MGRNAVRGAGLAAVLALFALGAGTIATPRADAAGPPIIGGAMGFPAAGSPSPGRTVLRVSVNPNGASLSSVKVVQCFRGTCLFGGPASTGFFQATFAVPPPVGMRVAFLVVACTPLGCTRAVRTALVSQPASG